MKIVPTDIAYIQRRCQNVPTYIAWILICAWRCTYRGVTAVPRKKKKWTARLFEIFIWECETSKKEKPHRIKVNFVMIICLPFYHRFLFPLTTAFWNSLISYSFLPPLSLPYYHRFLKFLDFVYPPYHRFLSPLWIDVKLSKCLWNFEI